MVNESDIPGFPSNWRKSVGEEQQSRRGTPFADKKQSSTLIKAITSAMKQRTAAPKAKSRGTRKAGKGHGKGIEADSKIHFSASRYYQ
jgi:hypothetical protein